MKLYIARHGEAFDVGEKGILSDYDRNLTPKGKKHTKVLASLLCKAGFVPNTIISSPLIRAAETATILTGCMKSVLDVKYSNSLEPDAHPHLIIRELNEYPETASVMIVGHMPNLSLVADVLIYGKAIQGITFRKSGACMLSFPGKVSISKGTLEWLIYPGITKFIP